MTTQIVTAAVMVSGELVNLEVTATDGTAANWSKLLELLGLVVE
jgi:hypothetical protein